MKKKIYVIWAEQVIRAELISSDDDTCTVRACFPVCDTLCVRKNETFKTKFGCKRAVKQRTNQNRHYYVNALNTVRTLFVQTV